MSWSGDLEMSSIKWYVYSTICVSLNFQLMKGTELVLGKFCFYNQKESKGMVQFMCHSNITPSSQR